MVRGKQVRRWYWNGRISPWYVFAWMKMPEPPKKKKYLVISEIKWDLSDEEVNFVGEDLPDTMSIEIDQENEYLLEDLDGYSDEICEYLSNTFGYCVKGFATDVIEAI